MSKITGMENFGTPQKCPDGTEGYASITLTLKEPDPKIETIACIIKNDELLQELQRENQCDLYVTTHKETKFFLYFFCSQSNLSNRLVKSEIVAHRFTKPNKDKNCTIENKLETQPFFLRDNHVFLPVCHEVFKTNDFEGFLTKHSSAVTMKNISAGTYRGVQNSNAPVKYLSFSLSSSNGTLNIPIPSSNVFQNLVDGPLLLLEEASWRLIGWYKTTQEKNRIIIHNLITQDTTDIWKTSILSNQTGGSQPPPNPSGSTSPPTSTNSQVGEDEPIKELEDESERRESAPGMSLEEEDGVPTVQPRVEPGHEVIINPLNQVHAQEEAAPALLEDPSVADPLPVNQPVATSLQDQPPSGSNANVSSDGANGQQYPVLQNKPTENSMQYTPPIQSSDSNVGLSSHSVNVQQALQDLLNEDCVVDCLARSLDIYYNSKNNWRHLADKMKAPQEVKNKCNCNTVHSPTLTVLERPDIRNKTIQELIKIMNTAANITYVSNFLKEKFPDRNKSIEEALRCNPELMDEIATKLDQPSNRILENWKDFGKALGIDEDELDLIENGGHNPAEELLLYAYSSLPPAKMKAKEFQRIIMGFTNREDLHKLLVTLGITENDVRHLKDIIPPNSENMKIMTAALNRCSPGLQNWKNLAYSWGRDAVHFDYPPKQSPTKTLLEWVCKTMDRKFTVDHFLNILGEIERYDVKQKLEEVIEKNR